MHSEEEPTDQSRVETDVTTQSRRSHLVLSGAKSTDLGCHHFQIMLGNETFVYNLEKKIK